MKSILISIKPEWVVKILNGKKTIEIRKTMPKCDLPIEVYIYCTKGGLPLEYIEGHGFSLSVYNPQSYKPKDLRGKVVAKFMLNKVEEYSNDELWDMSANKRLLEQSCVSFPDLMAYSRSSPIYAWHISDLEIFDKPKELSEFGVKRAPQSWQYIEVEE